MVSQSIIEAQYFPPISTIHLLAYTPIRIEQYDHYQKRSFRNKCIINSANGNLCLTVPLKKGKHEQQKTKDVKIAYYENWPRLHLQSLRSSYGKSPFFDYYFPIVERILTSRPRYLIELNLKTIKMVQEVLSFSLSTNLSLAYYPSNTYKFDFRDLIGIRNYQNHPDIMVPNYPQVFIDRWGFLPNLSILDLLFCQGPESINIIKNITFDFKAYS